MTRSWGEAAYYSSLSGFFTAATHLLKSWDTWDGHGWGLLYQGLGDHRLQHLIGEPARAKLGELVLGLEVGDLARSGEGEPVWEADEATQRAAITVLSVSHTWNGLQIDAAYHLWLLHMGMSCCDDEYVCQRREWMT